MDEIKNENLEMKEQTEELNLLVLPKVEISQERYEELIKAEATLEILGRVIAEQKPYELRKFKAVAGKYIPDEKDGDDE